MMSRLPVVFLFLVLAGCTLNPLPEPTLSEGHLRAERDASDMPPRGNIPAPVTVTVPLPEPEALADETVHTVVVYDVPVRELLFTLARDADLNLDVDPGIDALISINAIEQPLTALLDRIADNANLRYEIRGKVLRVQRDVPVLRNYSVDYLNMVRSSTGSVAVSTQISSTGGSVGGTESSSGGSGNSSDTVVRSTTEHAFWRTLEDNIDRILNRQGDVAGSTGVGSNPDIIVNSESGTLTVRATARQHEDIQQFLNTVQLSTQRQVLIEATIAEVILNDTYQAGIDWTLINSDPDIAVTTTQTLTDIALSTPPVFSIALENIDSDGNQLQATLRALETFGDVSIMSSPKVMAMNNQTALLKVVDNLIYFTVEVNIDSSSGVVGGGTLTTFETEVNTVPVGFVMSVTPYISEASEVILNVRPTISRVINYVQDPNPALADANVVSEIPVIQVREVESILKVGSGNIAVIGGLMQDEVKRADRRVPFLQRLPGVGRVFRYDDNETSKSELVIFLKPTVIENASITGELSEFGRYLPARAQ